MRSNGNVKECAETAQFRLCKHDVNESGHVPHVYHNTVYCVNFIVPY